MVFNFTYGKCIKTLTFLGNMILNFIHLNVHYLFYFGHVVKLQDHTFKSPSLIYISLNAFLMEISFQFCSLALTFLLLVLQGNFLHFLPGNPNTLAPSPTSSNFARARTPRRRQFDMPCCNFRKLRVNRFKFSLVYI